MSKNIANQTSPLRNEMLWRRFETIKVFECYESKWWNVKMFFAWPQLFSFLFFLQFIFIAWMVWTSIFGFCKLRKGQLNPEAIDVEMKIDLKNRKIKKKNDYYWWHFPKMARNSLER